MAGDLFGDAVQEGWNSGKRLTDTFLSEHDDFQDDAPPAAAPQAQPQAPAQPSAQPSAQPRNPLVPEGYEPPSALQAKRDALVRRYKTLDAKLAKARNRDAESNPYTFVGDSGHNEFDNLAYNDDMRALGSLKMEIDTITEKLRDSRETANVSQEGVRKYARDFYFRMEKSVDAPLRDTVKAHFSHYFSDLVRKGHFESPANLTPERLEAALGNIFRASLGSAMIERTQNRGTPAKSPGTTEDDPPRADDQDEFADWPEESKKMFAAFERAESAKGGTLADRARRQGGSR